MIVTRHFFSRVFDRWPLIFFGRENLVPSFGHHKGNNPLSLRPKADSSLFFLLILPSRFFFSHLIFLRWWLRLIIYAYIRTFRVPCLYLFFSPLNYMGAHHAHTALHTLTWWRSLYIFLKKIKITYPWGVVFILFSLWRETVFSKKNSTFFFLYL